MRLSFVSLALFVALISTCSGAGEVEETIDIDGGNVEGMAAAIMEAEMMADGSGGGELTNTDDEDLVGDIGSGLGNNDLVDNGDTVLTSVPPVDENNNEIPDNQGKPDPTIGNGLGPIYEETNERNSNDALNGDGTNMTQEPQNIFEKILSNPAILAGMVGAVVLILLTVVLSFLFVIYRIKKKDEGSYSLDEPHKVKDPTAYWKDTKEFYA